MLLSSKLIKLGATLQSKNSVKNISGQKEEETQIYWILSSSKNLTTNLKKEMQMNCFINLIKEESIQVLNGNANFEILNEKKSRKKSRSHKRDTLKPNWLFLAPTELMQKSEVEITKQE